ncbi:ABC transporter substrate-binding protein [Archangium violaceum]|uniref:ABC transporter substrate-binding protein n=1 Tax=Archangium violaceum TaxID=83451 RepID=UPI001950D6E5|nr:ABC transporter substrate-binding protein [Archangium violaceum]QRN95591.1 ABC transporter substrate-binding protein [Archangium violaceum]
MRALSLMGMLSLLATGCSFTTAGGLDQCETSADCASNQICTRNVCLPLPTGCNEKPFGSADPGAIALGALVPVHTSTEPGAGVDVSDEQALNALLLALDELNQRGIVGKQIALYYCDTSSDVERARRQAEWLVNDKKVAAVVTAGSSQSLEVAKVTIGKNVLLMSYSASSPELTVLADTNGGAAPAGLVWRTSPSDAIQGSVIAHLLRTDSRFGPQTTTSKVGILYVDDPYGQGLANIISERLLNGDVSRRVPNRTFSYPKRGDVKSAVDQLEMYAPNLTVLIGFADDAAAILKEAATRPTLQRIPDGPHRWFFSDSVKDAALLTDSQAAAQARDFHGTAPAQGTGQAFSTFQNRFLDKYKKDPAAYAYTSNAYDAMYLLGLSASWSLGTSNTVTGPKLAEGLTKVSTGTSSTQTQLTNSNFTYLSTELAAGRSVNVDGASGQLNFDASGESSAPVELWQVGASGFVTIPPTLDPP